MTTINDTYINALLADATYVGGLSSGANLVDRLSPRMTPTLAKFIDDNFIVKSQIDSNDISGSGFDATVWQGKPTSEFAGKTFVSMRGTETDVGPADLSADVDLTLTGVAHLQYVDMVNWWFRITTPANLLAPQVQSIASVAFTAGTPVFGTGELVGPGAIDVNGHSLGGHLAAAFARIFGASFVINSINTFNSAGFTALSPASFHNLATVLSTGVNGYLQGIHTNNYAVNGINVTTNTSTTIQLGSRVPLFNENSSTQIPNHFMYKLTDALALASAMSKLDTNLDMSLVNRIFESGSNQMIASIEGVFDGLNRFLNGPGITKLVPVDANNSDPERKNYHEKLKELTESDAFKQLKGKVNIRRSDSSLASQAREDFGALVSLVSLSPIALTANGDVNKGAVESQLQSAWSNAHSAWQADKNLSSEDKAAGKQTYTDRWMSDRAAMVGWIAKKNEKDIADGNNLTGAPGTLATKYTDIKSNTTLTIGAAALQQYKEIYFGNDSDNTFAGNGKDDALYGGGGIDVLSGQGGNDYLEGNAGDDELNGGAGKDVLVGGTGGDKYIFDAGFGADTVIDSDGQGRITVADIGELNGGNKKAEGGYESIDKKVQYTVVQTGSGSGKDLIITFEGKPDSIRVKNWKDNDLGIQLLQGTVPTLQPMDGDFKKKLVAGSTELYEVDAARNYVADGEEADALDVIVGSSGPDWIRTKGGDDAAAGGEGDDTIEGGAGDDYLVGGAGKNVIMAGGGNDLVYVTGQVNFERPEAVSATAPELPGGATEIGRGFSWITYKAGGRFYAAPSEITFANDAALNFVDGGAGDDRVVGGKGDEILLGAEGDDRIWGMAGADVIEGGEGNDILDGGGFVPPGTNNYLRDQDDVGDTLSGGEGNDRILGVSGDDVLYGDAGDDELYGDAGGGSLDEVEAEYAGADLLDGGTGNDNLYGGSKGDILRGGEGNDYLSGDKDSPDAGDDYLEGGAGDDSLEGDAGNDALSGGDDQDLMYGGDGEDFLDGGAGEDSLDGGDSDDYLQGGEGQDRLRGGNGNDVLIGGLGADFLEGGAGDDYYAFDTNDTIVENTTQTADGVNDNEGANTIVFEAATAANLQVTKSPNATNSIALVAGDATNVLYLVNGTVGVQNTVVLGSGEELTTNELIGQYADTSGSGGVGVFSAIGGIANSQEFTMAGRGNDFVVTSMQGSTLSGGRGDDMLYGAGANNTYLYAAGDGQDTIKDGSVINGSLSPLGASTIQFGKGITAADVTLSASISPTEGAGLLAGLNGVPLQNRYLVVNIGGGTLTVPPGKIAIDGFDFTDPNAPLPVAKLKFADESELMLADLLASSGVLTTGTNGSDAVQGTWRAETLSGGQGDDTLNGEAGGDTYRWGLGDGKDKVVDEGPSSDIDTLQLLGTLTPADLKFSRVANDLIVRIATANGTTGDELTIKDHFAGVGTDGAGQSISQGIDKVVFGNSVVWSRADISANLVGLPPVTLTEGSDNYQGTAGSDSVSAIGGNDTVVGNEGNDTVDGGAGNDAINGDGGDDRLLGGFGNDSLSGGADNDVLLGGAGDDNLFGSYGNDLLEDHEGNNLFIGGEGDDTIRGFGNRGAVGGVGNDDIEISGAGAVNGDDGDDRLVDLGTEGVLYGGFGNDTLIGGNTMWGESGSDTYVVSGTTINRIHEHDVNSNDIDTVVLPVGTHAGNVNFVRYVGDGVDSLVIGYDTKDRAVLVNYFGDDPLKSGVDVIKLGDNTVMDRAAVMAVAKGLPIGTPNNDNIIGYRYDETLDGGLGNDTINGGSGDDLVNGGAGNDQLEGFNGDDTLDGGIGDDALAGGDGNDTFLFGRHSGKDKLGNFVTTAQNDRILVSADVLPSDLKVLRNVDDLILQIEGSDAQFTVMGYYRYFSNAGAPISVPGSFSGFQRIEFAGGSANWSHTDIAARLAAPTSVVTTVNGVDTLSTSQSANLAADIENITAVGLLDVRLVGNVGHNVITGNAGNNSLNGFYNLADPSAWVNWTTDARPANAFDITFSPSFQNGQKGKDTLVGGAGDDTYFVNGGEQAPSVVGSVELPPVNGDDVVVELAGEGNDTVVTRNYSETLTANVENLIALNPNAYYLPATASSPEVRLPHAYTGNALDNRIDAYQVFHSTRIDGGAGADTMYGSTRSSEDSTIYIVDNPGDVVIEVNESQVIYSLGDRVESSITYTLGSAIEDLTLTGGSAIDGTGNSNANQLRGNDAANVLEGLAGNDNLDGGLGNDTYLYGLGEGVDTIQEATPDTSPGKLNVLRLKAGIQPSDVVVKQVGNNLEVVVCGENQKVIVKGFFSGGSPAPGNPIQRIEFDAGAAWDVAKILTLLTPNTPPVLVHPLADVAVNQGDNFNIAMPAGTFVDPDAGDNLTYKLTLADGSAVPNWFNHSFNAQTGAVGGQAPGDWAGTLSVKLTALDKNGAQASDVFDIAVGVENRVVNGTTLGDELTGYWGNDSLYGNGGPDVINGNSGNDLLDGGDSFDKLDGGAGMDTLIGGEGRDFLKGGADNDLLQGGGGDDDLTGGLGDDTLDGGLGNEVYLFSKGDGSDVILEAVPDSTPGKMNTLVLTYGIIESDVSVKKVGVDLEVTIADTSDKMTVKSFFAGTGPNDASNPIQRIFFEGLNKTWDIAKIQSLVSGQNTVPTLAHPLPDQSVNQGAVLTYTVAADAFADADVGDVLTYSAKQSDSSNLPPWLNFNASTRTFSGTAPTDYVGSLSVKVTATDTKGNVASDLFDIVVGAENKTLTGSSAADVLAGYSGDDTLYGLGGNDSLTGNDGNDRLDGGVGTDTLRGGMGSDTYVVDTASEVVFEIEDVPGTDTIESSVTLTLPTGVEGLTLLGAANIDATGNSLSNLIVGNSGNNRLDGGIAPTFFFKPSNDTLRGGAGDDTYVIREQLYTTYGIQEAEGEGVDTVEFNSSNNNFTLPTNVENLVITGTAISASGNQQDNVITGNGGNNILYGAEGADTLYGLTGNDTLEGGLEFGNFSDVLDGGLGDDTYRYQVGGGQDVVVETVPDPRADKQNVLFIYGLGLASEVIATNLVRVGNDLEVRVGAGTDKVTVKSFFAGSGPDNSLNPVQQIKFANGTIWNMAEILSHVTSGGTPSNTAPVLSTPLADQSSPQGAPVNYTLPGNTFTDADVSDALTYSASLSSGAALPSWLSFNPSTRTFSGTAPTDSVGTTSIKVTATDAAGASASDVFDWAVAAENKSLTGTSGADVLVGYSGNDSLSGATGNDSLSGNAGNDLLDGGAGADVIDGGSGNDVVLFGLGDGQDVMQEATADSVAGKLNILRIKSGVLPAQVSVNRVGADLEVLIAGGSDKVTVKSFFAGTGPLAATNPLQRIEFFDGSSWDIAHIQTLVNTPVNTAPVVNSPLADQAVQQGAAINYVVPTTAFTDADVGDVLTYTATQSNGTALPSWLSFSASTRTFSGTAPNTAGATSIKVVATDSAGATASDVFDLVVNQAPPPPSGGMVTVRAFSTLADNLGPLMQVWVNGVSLGEQEVRATEYQNYSFNSAQSIPEGAKIEVVFPNDGIDTIGRDRNLFVDSITVNGSTISATAPGVIFDRGVGPQAFDQLDVMEGVNNLWWSGALRFTAPGAPPVAVNTAPVVNSPLADQAVQQGAAVNYVVPTTAFTDADEGDVLSYTATQYDGSALPSWLSFSASTRTFSGTAPSTLGTTSIKVVATDSAGATASDVFDLVVNQVPPLPPGGGTVTVRASASLADNLGPLMQVWVNGVSLGEQEVRATEYQNYSFNSAQSIPEGAKIEVVFPNDGIDTIGRDRNLFVDSITVNGSTISATAPGVIFDRGVGPQAFDQLDVMEGVNNLWWSGALRFTAPGAPPVVVNTAPVVNSPLADQAVQQGAAITYVVPAMTLSDADVGGVLSYKATQNDGSALPSWLSFSASTRTFSGTAPNTGGATSIKVVATDSAGSTASDVFDLTVIAADNTLPAKNLVGTSGNDTLFGDTGNDVLDGGSGNDTYYFGRGQGQDLIRDLEWSANTDVLKFLSGVQAEQLWFRAAGNDLEISIIGTTDKVTVRDWYQGEVHWVEQFKTADGRTLNAQNVNAMVSAMAGLTPPPLGQTSLSTSQQAVLAPAFAANWILPAASSSNTNLDTFTTESSMKTASTNKLLNGESAKMSMPDPQSQAMISSREGGFGDAPSATASMPVKNPRPENSTVKNPPLRGTENALLETGPNVLLQTWDLPLGGKGDQAAWNPAVLPGKKYLAELSMDTLTQLNAQAPMEASLHSLINAMAAFAPPAAGEVTLGGNEPDGFKQVIAVDWAA